MYWYHVEDTFRPSIRVSPGSFWRSFITLKIWSRIFIIRIDGEKYEVESGREKKLLIQKRRILGENLMETILDALFYVILVTMNSYQL